jgi:hypothetical protein
MSSSSCSVDEVFRVGEDTAIVFGDICLNTFRLWFVGLQIGKKRT